MSAGGRSTSTGGTRRHCHRHCCRRRRRCRRYCPPSRSTALQWSGCTDRTSRRPSHGRPWLRDRCRRRCAAGGHRHGNRRPARCRSRCCRYWRSRERRPLRRGTRSRCCGGSTGTWLRTGGKRCCRRRPPRRSSPPRPGRSTTPPSCCCRTPASASAGSSRRRRSRSSGTSTASRWPRTHSRQSYTFTSVVVP